MIFISNIDTLYFLVDIENYQTHCKDILDFLRKEKEFALYKYKNGNNCIHLIDINNMTFSINHTGSKGYAFIIKNADYEISIAEYRSKIESFKPIKIRISSEALWNIGILESYNTIINWIQTTFGNIISESVYRIDLCNHSNIDYITNYDKSYKGNFKKRNINYSGSNINAICFGSRDNKLIYCRIYNKTLEIEETKKKTWFKEIWKNNNLDVNNIWNLEFEIKSDFLRSKNLITFNDVYNHLQDLWRYCTETWLLKINPTKTRSTRCEINSDWLEIQNAFNNFSCNGLIDREIIYNSDASILVPTIVGFITSYSANKKITNIENALSNLKIEFYNYFISKNTTFEKTVQKKISTQGGVSNE